MRLANAMGPTYIEFPDFHMLKEGRRWIGDTDYASLD